MRNNRKNRKERKRRIKWDHVLIWFVAAIVTVTAIWLLLRLIPGDDIDVDKLLSETTGIKYETETEPESETEDGSNPVPMPDVDVQPGSK